MALFLTEFYQFLLLKIAKMFWKSNSWVLCIFGLIPDSMTSIFSFFWLWNSFYCLFGSQLRQSPASPLWFNSCFHDFSIFIFSQQDDGLGFNGIEPKFQTENVQLSEDLQSSTSRLRVGAQRPWVTLFFRVREQEIFPGKALTFIYLKYLCWAVCF